MVKVDIPPDKRRDFEFHGGPLDGSILVMTIDSVERPPAAIEIEDAHDKRERRKFRYECFKLGDGGGYQCQNIEGQSLKVD